MTQSVWLIGASSLIKNSHSLICSHELRWHLSNLLVKHSEQYFQESVCPRNSIQVSHLHFYTTIKQNNKKPQCDYFMLHYWSQIHHWRWLFICVHSFIFFSASVEPAGVLCFAQGFVSSVEVMLTLGSLLLGSSPCGPDFIVAAGVITRAWCHTAPADGFLWASGCQWEFIQLAGVAAGKA